MPDYPKEELWKEYEKEQLWKRYKNLPKNLQEAVFSEDIATIIYKLCKKNNVEESLMSKIAKQVGHIFLGMLSPDILEEKLISELQIEKGKAKKISSEINQFILLPLKTDLENIYGIKMKRNIAGENLPKNFLEEETIQRKKDVYLEEIE